MLNEDGYEYVAKKFRVTKKQVEEVVSSMFELVADEMRRGSKMNIRVPYLGAFKVNPKKDWVINNKEKYQLNKQKYEFAREARRKSNINRTSSNN